MKNNDHSDGDFTIIDASAAEQVIKREKIRQILGLSSCDDFSIIQWNDPQKVKPFNATYVLLKVKEPELGLICYDAAYENGRFLNMDSDSTISVGKIVAWSYPPFDDYCDMLGRFIHEKDGMD